MDVVERLSVPKKHFTQYKPLPVSSLLSVAWSLVRNVKTLARILRWGWGGERIPYDGQYGKASPESDIFFRPYVYERVGISLVFKYIKE